MTIETSFGKISASGATLNALALSLFRAAELAIGVNVIYAEQFCNDAMSFYNALEVNGYYKIKED